MHTHDTLPNSSALASNEAVAALRASTTQARDESTKQMDALREHPNGSHIA